MQAIKAYRKVNVQSFCGYFGEFCRYLVFLLDYLSQYLSKVKPLLDQNEVSEFDLLSPWLLSLQLSYDFQYNLKNFSVIVFEKNYREMLYLCSGRIKENLACVFVYNEMVTIVESCHYLA